MEERLQKILSAAGAASRRSAEGYITAGRVTVNGRTACLGDKADPERDDIRLDGRPLRGPERRTYLMLHKPRGFVTTLSDEKGRRTVAELVRGCGARVWPVGRLDLDSEGLLLMTDDGALTHRMIHPRHEVEKEYHVWVTGDTERGLPVLRGPLSLDGIPLHPAQVKLLRREGRRASSRWSFMRGATGRSGGCALWLAWRSAGCGGCGREAFSLEIFRLGNGAA